MGGKNMIVNGELKGPVAEDGEEHAGTIPGWVNDVRASTRTRENSLDYLDSSRLIGDRGSFFLLSVRISTTRRCRSSTWLAGSASSAWGTQAPSRTSARPSPLWSAQNVRAPAIRTHKTTHTRHNTHNTQHTLNTPSTHPQHTHLNVAAAVSARHCRRNST